MSNYPGHFKKLFGTVALLTLVYAGVEIYLGDTLWDVKNLTHFLPFVVVLVVYRFGAFYRPIKFDSEFFYVENTQNSVPLSCIQSIKLTELSDGFNNRYWQVTYLTDKLDSVRVLPSIIDDSFLRFINAVKEVNPSVDTDAYEFKLYFGFIPSVRWEKSAN